MSRQIALDIEGDGWGPSSIVELALVELDDFKLTGKFHSWRVKPPGRISRYATRVHHITDRDVAKALPFAAIADEVRLILQAFPIVGHNVRGDMIDLQRELSGWEPEAAYDTVSLGKVVMPGLEFYKLTKLGESLGLLEKARELTARKPHSALFDATLCALVADDLLERLPCGQQIQALAHNNVLRGKQKTVFDAGTLFNPG